MISLWVRNLNYCLVNDASPEQRLCETVCETKAKTGQQITSIQSLLRLLWRTSDTSSSILFPSSSSFVSFSLLSSPSLFFHLLRSSLSECSFFWSFYWWVFLVFSNLSVQRHCQQLTLANLNPNTETPKTPKSPKN